MVLADICGNRTKCELEGALKEMLRQKPLDQIRVRELTELCGIRRQSFYYHFTDIYELFSWSIQQERTALCRRQEDCLTWQQALRDLLEHAERNRAYYQAVLKNQGRTGLRDLLQAAVSQLLEKTLAYYRKRCGAPPDEAEEQAQLACWETILLALLEGWLCGDLEQTPEEVIALMEKSVQQSAVGAAWQNLPHWGDRNKK